MPPVFSFTYGWPYLGLAGALALAVLLASDRLCSDRKASRWRDPVWLAWAGTWIYLVHQFEEHGIDAEGGAYAFRGFMCASLGFASPASCPVPFSFITSVNIAAVWLAGPAAALLGRRWPALALSFFSIPFVNAIAHLAPAALAGAYNPGVVTSIVLFLPLSLWAFHVALGRRDLGWRAVIATIAAGFVLHAILMGSLMAYVQGLIGVVALDAIQIVNPAIAGLIVFLATRRPAA